jgi:hypothetical protein
MNKIGAFVWPRSLIWLFSGAIFLYLALMPFFDVFPYNFEVGETLLRVMIVIVGILILFESFRRGVGIRKFFWVLLGAIIAAFGIYIFLMGVNVKLPFEFGINKIILQVILALYSIYLLIGAWEQVKIVEQPQN